MKNRRRRFPFNESETYQGRQSTIFNQHSPRWSYNRSGRARFNLRWSIMRVSIAIRPGVYSCPRGNRSWYYAPLSTFAECSWCNTSDSFICAKPSVLSTQAGRSVDALRSVSLMKRFKRISFCSDLRRKCNILLRISSLCREVWPKSRRRYLYETKLY